MFPSSSSLPHFPELSISNQLTSTGLYLQQVGEDVESSVPEGLARIIRRGLAKDPDERYESAQALDDALGSLQP